MVYITAENIAEACSITRQEQDEFALQSQLKCEQAVSLQHFDTEIEPIIISSTKRKGILFLNISYFFLLDDVEIRHDEYPRKGSSIDAMSKLNTVFKDCKFLHFKVVKYLFSI